MTDLSPAAQAVYDAYLADQGEIDFVRADRFALAAALRAAALHVYSDEHETCGGASYALMIDVDDLLSIAAELEAQ